MLSSFIEWFVFHCRVLESRKLPIFIFFLGLLIAYGATFAYWNLVNKLSDSMFHKLILDNIDILNYGLRIIPLVIVLFFGGIAIAQHKKNIRQFHD